VKTSGSSSSTAKERTVSKSGGIERHLGLANTVLALVVKSRDRRRPVRATAPKTLAVLSPVSADRSDGRKRNLPLEGAVSAKTDL
jgi:hypothetical protein